MSGSRLKRYTFKSNFQAQQFPFGIFTDNLLSFYAAQLLWVACNNQITIKSVKMKKWQAPPTGWNEKRGSHFRRSSQLQRGEGQILGASQPRGKALWQRRLTIEEDLAGRHCLIKGIQSVMFTFIICFLFLNLFVLNLGWLGGLLWFICLLLSQYFQAVLLRLPISSCFACTTSGEFSFFHCSCPVESLNILVLIFFCSECCSVNRKLPQITCRIEMPTIC